MRDTGLDSCRGFDRWMISECFFFGGVVVFQFIRKQIVSFHGLNASLMVKQVDVYRLIKT